MTKMIFALAAVLLFPLASFEVQAAPAPKTCAWLLQSQKPPDELLRLLHAVTPDVKSRVDWIWIADSLSLTDLKDLKISAHAAGLQVVFDQFLADENRVVGHFHLNGTIRQQATFVSGVPEMKGLIKWTEAFTPHVEKRALIAWKKVNDDLARIGIAEIPFQKGLSDVDREMVVFSLKDDTYLSPRIAYVFEQEKLEIWDLGEFEDLESAFKVWKPGGHARVRVGPESYLLAEREMLEAIRSVKSAELAKAGIKLDLDIKSWLQKRVKAAPVKAKKAVAGPAPRKAPPQYGFTEWSSGKYKTSFKEESTKPGGTRPFTIVRWSKTPAWAVVNAHYLEEHGVEKTLGALEAFVPLAVRKTVLAELEDYVKDPVAAKTLPHTRLGGESGKFLMNEMLEEDFIKAFAPRNSPEQRVVVFPLGTVRSSKQEEPSEKQNGMSLLNGTDHEEVTAPAIAIEPVNLEVRRTPTVRIEFVPGTGYQSKLVDLNSFEEQVLAAGRALPGEGDVAIEQDNQGMLMRFHVAYRAVEGEPVQILSLRRIDESETVPRRLEFAPSIKVEKMISNREAFRKRLFKGVDYALPAPNDYEVSEFLVSQSYQGKQEWLRVRFSEYKGTILVNEISVQQPSERDAFYQRLATYHQVSKETYSHELPDITVGTKKVSTIVIPPEVRARNELENDITQELEQRILAEVNVAAKQPASRTYRSRVQIEKQVYIVNLHMRMQTAFLKEIYPLD